MAGREIQPWEVLVWSAAGAVREQETPTELQLQGTRRQMSNSISQPVVQVPDHGTPNITVHIDRAAWPAALLGDVQFDLVDSLF